MIPRAKQYKNNEGVFSLPLIFPNTEDGNASVLVLSRFLPAISAKTGKKATVILKKLEDHEKGEYALSVTSSAVTLSYGDFEGLRNALATLASIYMKDGFSCAAHHFFAIENNIGAPKSSLVEPHK